MIISHYWKFIFVKTAKTAGTSAEIALSKICKEGDIVSKISKADERLREGLDVAPVNLVYKRTDGLKRVSIRNHSPLQNALMVIPPEAVNYTIVSIERNPWDKAISGFFWDLQRKDVAWSDDERGDRLFKNWLLPRSSIGSSNYELYSICNVPVVDFMLRTEHLAEDLNRLGAKIGFAGKLSDEMPRVKAKSHARPKEATRKRFFRDKVMMDMIRYRASQQIQTFGYSFKKKSCKPYKPPLGLKALLWEFYNKFYAEDIYEIVDVSRMAALDD